MDVFQMDGRTALVTGAAGGIGLATAAALAGHGARVALLDLDLAATTAAAATVAAHGNETLALAADVSDPGQVEAAVQSVIQRWGRLDIVVPNAGIHSMVPLLELSDAEFERMLNVLVLGTYHCVAAALPTMLEQGSGTVVATASVAGISGSKLGASHYAAAKGAIIAFIRSLAREMGPHCIRANCVAPGQIATPMTAGFGEREIDAYTRGIPLGRLGQPEEVADAIVFLASDASRYMTGQVLNVCGGALVG